MAQPLHFQQYKDDESYYYFGGDAGMLVAMLLKLNDIFANPLKGVLAESVRYCMAPIAVCPLISEAHFSILAVRFTGDGAQICQ